jgi:outer membrane protein assembly factor BamB
LEWSETKNVRWKTPLEGTGWSSPVILDGQIWMTTAVDLPGDAGAKSLRALCVDRESGKLAHDLEVFRVEHPESINAKNSYASPTPVIEPGRVYVHFGTYGTACLDTTSAKILWKNDHLKLEHKEGPGSSPILCGDLLVFNCDGMDVQFVVALDKRTGSIAWKTDRSGSTAANPDHRKAYSTPLLIRAAGRNELISTGADRTVAYDPITGRELWKVEYKGFSIVPRPLFGHGLLYIVTDFARAQLWAVRPGGTDNVTETHVVWRVKKQVPSEPSPVLVGDAIYMVSDKGVATCLDALSGEERWTERLGGNYSASPLAAEGRIYFLNEEGKTLVIAPAKEFKLLAESQLDGRQMASPAVSGNALFIRTDTHLYRIESQ